MLRAPAMRRLVALALLALSSAALASAQQTNSTRNATSSTPAAPAPPTTPPAATITVITPSQCELENRRIMDQDWGPYQKMLRDCEYFIRTGLRVHCTSECAYRARVFADLVAANAGLRTCVLGDPKSRTIVNLFAKEECGRRSPKLEGADVVYDSDGNPLTFRGAPDYEAEKGLSFVHPNDHPAPDTTPVIRNQQPLATTQKHVQAQIAQGNNAPQLNGTTNAAPRTNASGSGNVTVSNPPKFRAVNGTVTNGTAASNSTSNATTNATSPADANAKIDRNADPNTWNWEGKPVRPINRTNVGRPLSPKQIELISPIDDGKGFFLPGAVANTAFGRNQTALTREEVAICVGPLGPLQRVRSGCSVFLNRVPSALLFPLEQTVDSNANVSATSTQKEINALNAHKKAMAKSWEAYKTCPDDCTNALRFFRLVVDGAFHVSKCLRLKTYAHTFTALRNTVCDPIRVGLVPGGRFSAIPDPLDAPNIALKQPMPERITRRSYVGRLSMPPPRKPEKVRNDNLNQFRVPGVNTTANVSALLLGGGNVGASRAAPKTGENNATQVASLESIRAFKGWNGLEPAEDYGLPTAETDAYAKAGFCRGDGVNFEIGPDGTPRYCKPRPPKIKLDRGGKVVYDAQRGPRINYDAFLRLDKSGKPVYPRPLKTNSKIRRTTYERAEDYKKLQKVLSNPEHKPRAEVDSLLVNITQYGRGVNRGVPKVSADELLQKLALAADNPQTMEDTEFQALIRQILDNKGTATNGSVVSNTTDIAGIVANATAAANASSNATVVSRTSGSVHSLLRSLANAEQFETGYNGLEKDRIEFGASTRYTHDKRFQAINVGANATSNATTNATEPFPPQSNSTHTVSLVNVTIAGTELSYQAPYVLTNETIEEITVRKRVRNVPRPVPKPDNATDVLMSIEDEERFRTFFSHKLASLATAGYTDEKRNLRLLIKYHGDINKVLAVLTGNAKYADLNDVDDAALPQPRINVTRQVNLTVPIELANLTLPELLTRPQDPATNTTNSTAPAAPANTVNVSSPITTAIKVTGEDLKKAGVPYYFTSEKPVDIFDEAFSNGSQ